MAARRCNHCHTTLVQDARWHGVLLAAAGVFGTGMGWPDVVVAAVMGALGWQIVRRFKAEPRGAGSPALVPAGRG